MENLANRELRNKFVEYVTDTKNLELPKVADVDKAFNTLVDNFRKEEVKVEKSRLKSAFILLKIYDYDFYKLGYSNIYDFSAETFGLSRTSVNEALNVARRFGSYVEKSVFLEGYEEPERKYTPAYKLDGKYSSYSFSQLYYIRKLTDEQIEELGITPDCSVRAIRERINDYMNGLPDGIEETNVEELTADAETSSDGECGSDDVEPMNEPVENKGIVGLINL
ncbi:MAG: hypothetical protein NC086_10580, partial [Alistipes sp.]|nr:hypothetical protein [Alistipes sp.]